MDFKFHHCPPQSENGRKRQITSISYFCGKFKCWLGSPEQRGWVKGCSFGKRGRRPFKLKSKYGEFRSISFQTNWISLSSFLLCTTQEQWEVHLFSMGCTCALICLPFLDPFMLWECQFSIPLGVHLEILYGYCIYIPCLCPPGWQRGHSCVCSCFKEDMLTVVRRERLHTPGGPPPWHLMKAWERKWFLFFFFQIKWFGWIASRQPEATLFHLLPMTTENVISILISIFSIYKSPWTSKNQTTDCDNRLDFEARLLFIVIQSLKRFHNFGPFH